MAAEGRQGKGYFTLGRWGLPINVLAVSWGIFMAVNLIWPRKEVYNATAPFHWYLQYGAILFIGIVFFGGLAYYWFVQRHKTGVLESHRFQSASEAVPQLGAMTTRMFIDGEWCDAPAAPPSRPPARPPASRSARWRRATARMRAVRSPPRTRRSPRGGRAPASSAGRCSTAWPT